LETTGAWPEEKIRALLAKVFARLQSSGGLLAAEKLLTEDKTGPRARTLDAAGFVRCKAG